MPWTTILTHAESLTLAQVFNAPGWTQKDIDELAKLLRDVHARAFEWAIQLHEVNLKEDSYRQILREVIGILRADICPPTWEEKANTMCEECHGGRVRVYPGTPLGQVETCRRCVGKGYT